jgi:hypothetical protein
LLVHLAACINAKALAMASVSERMEEIGAASPGMATTGRLVSQAQHGDPAADHVGGVFRCRSAYAPRARRRPRLLGFDHPAGFMRLDDVNGFAIRFPPTTTSDAIAPGDAWSYGHLSGRAMKSPP